ncbi:MAG: hypothetical protein JWQ97_2305 [Phenylobacterium sp.]|nr:hypothetical protein [Phenylobacterium sp.]
MSQRSRRPATRPLSLKDAFEREYARRELERRARDEAERLQQERDLEGAEQLHAALADDPGFLEARGLTADRRRYTVSLDHARFRIAAYFDGGKVAVTLSDKRAAPASAASPRRQDTVEGAEDALRLIAQFLVEETR